MGHTQVANRVPGCQEYGSLHWVLQWISQSDGNVCSIFCFFSGGASSPELSSLSGSFHVDMMFTLILPGVGSAGAGGPGGTDG